MSANIDADGTIRQLDRLPEPDEVITEAAVQEPKQLARFLLRLFRDVSTLKRRWMPRRRAFRGIVSTGSSGSPMTSRLAHGFGGPVYWWVAKDTNAGAVTVPYVQEMSTSDENTLVLQIYYPATLTILVEESG